jgi:hypothetical protein
MARPSLSDDNAHMDSSPLKPCAWLSVTAALATIPLKGVARLSQALSNASLNGIREWCMRTLTADRQAMLRLLQRFFRLTLLLLIASPAFAWNAAGHRISAMIAWEQLDADTRAAVTALLHQHPDFDRWQTRGKSASTRGLTAFLEASTWPDDIRKDQRFYTAGVEEPTPTLPGFPDMERRLDWHYVDRPLNPAGNLQSSPGKIDRQLEVLAQTLWQAAKQRSVSRAYALPWLIHLVADATSRCTLPVAMAGTDEATTGAMRWLSSIHTTRATVDEPAPLLGRSAGSALAAH